MTTESTETPTTPTESKLWTDRVAAFAKAVGKNPEDVAKAFTTLVGEASDDNAALLTDAKCVTDEDLLTAFSDAPKARVRKAIADMRAAAAPVASATTAKAASAAIAILPAPPDDESFLLALRTGGVPKVSATEVTAAIRIFVAHQLGLDEIPDRVLEMMELHAEQMEEPVGEEFVDVRKIVTERKYGEILEAIGLKGHSVTKEHRRKLASKMTDLPSVLGGFQSAVLGYRDEWMTQGANPVMMMQLVTTMMSGGGSPGLIQGMVAPPDTGAVAGAAEGVIDAFNKMFSGFGRATARVMGDDAVKVKKVLSDARVPTAIGVTSREEMLKKLGINVSSDMVRLETDLGRYVLAIYQIAEGKVASDQLPGYVVALANLGAQIPWERVGARTNNRRDGKPATSFGGKDPVGRQTF